MKSVFGLLGIFFLATSLCRDNQSICFSIEKSFYLLNGQRYCFLEYRITNNSNKDLVVWFDKEKKTNLKKYLLTLHGNFSLLNMISELLLTPIKNDICCSFLKLIPKGNSFDISYLVEVANDKDVEDGVRFLKHITKYSNIYELKELINLEIVKEQFYQKHKIFIPPNYYRSDTGGHPAY